MKNIKNILTLTKENLIDEKGSNAVEFAFILPILLILVMGIIQFGIIFNYYISITHAAREGVRWAALENTGAVVRIKTIDAAPSLNPPLVDENITITDDQGNPFENPTIDDQGNPITVSVSYDVPIFLPFMDAIFPDSTITLHSSATQRVE